jgi:hypothetical protein
VIVLGAGLAGLTTALNCVRDGRSVCVLEEGPTLGREISQDWSQSIPEGALRRRLQQLCESRGVPEDGPLDVFTATLALDRMVEEADIRVLVRVVPTRPVRDVEGRLQGVEFVGKSGRQLAHAPFVIDAAPNRMLSRRLLGLSAPPVSRAGRRLYVRGTNTDEMPSEFSVPDELGVAGNRVRAVPAAWPGEGIVGFEMSYDPPVEPGEAAQESLGVATEVMQHLRRHTDAFDSSTLVDVSPGIQGAHAGPAIESGRLHQTGLMVVPEDGSLQEQMEFARAVSSELLSPEERVALPQEESNGNTQRLAPEELKTAPEWDLPEAGLPEAVAQMHEPTDIVVVGWGTGGAMAALSAAREGASVTVVDPCALPGGIATAGRIHSYYHGKTGGTQDQIDELVKGRESELGDAVHGFHPIAKADVLQEEIIQSGVIVHSGHTAFAVVEEEGRVMGVITAAADGFHAFPCRVTIDGTGDGDVAAAAGADWRLGREGDGFPQPYSYTPSRVGDGTLGHHNFDAGWVDPTDTLDYSRAHFEGRRRLWEQGPFSSEHHYCTLASLLGIRESRFIIGPVTLSFQDFLEGKSYPDTVCDAYAHYDNHAVDYAEESEWARRHVVMCGQWRQMCQGEVPYRALYPQGVEGMLVACRALSVDHDMHQLLRMQRDMQQIGEVCGLAAAECVSMHSLPSEINVDGLRQKLGGRGLLPDKPAEGPEPSSVAEQLALLDTEEDGPAMWRLSQMSATDEAWDEYFQQETDDAARFKAAVAAALAGRDTEDVLRVLDRAVDSRQREPLLGVRAPAAFVIALLALNEIESENVSERIGNVLLDAELDTPAILLLLRALGDSGDRAGVEIIKRFLDQTEESEFQYPMAGCPKDLTTSFRYSVIIRAVRSLKALGCDDEDERLTPYLDSPHLLIRRHARRVARGE